jgi:Holliday junction resolvase RusA-like endonuclease
MQSFDYQHQHGAGSLRKGEGMGMIAFSVPGKPIGKGRPRATIRGGHAAMYTPAKTANYENKIALFCQQSMFEKGQKAFAAGVPLSVSIVAYFEIPKSWSKAKRAAAMYHTSKPDADNLIKCMDALNGIAWHDDSQVAVVSIRKQYDTSEPGIDVIIEAI